MPKAIIYTLLVLVILAMIPPALIARTRAVPNDRRRIHLVQDMDNQGKFRAQHAAPDIFADGRAMRPPVAGAVARGQLNEDEHFMKGVVRGNNGEPTWANAFPSQAPLTMDLLKRGQERFNIYCQPCHGASGYGDGMVHIRADMLTNAGTNGTSWVAPKSLHEQAIREQSHGQLFNSITNGVRNMPPYESQIPVQDRWAIVAYVRALQRSQHARIEDVPADMRDGLETIRMIEGGQP